MAYIKRDLFEKLKEHLSAKEISLIIGPRQAGKTTLMKALKDFLDDTGEKTLFLNLDYENDKRFFSDQDNLIGKIKLELGSAGGYVFIDEMQRKEDAGIFLKGIYDLGLPYKFIVSGSGSLELKEKIHESLAGRKRVFELNTVSFKEFADFKTGYRYKNKLLEFFKVEEKKGELLLEEYLNFGGYPRIVMEEKLSEKVKLIDEIFRSYLERDIAYLLKIEKTEAFSRMIKLLAAQTGNLINYSEIASNLNISVPTLRKYAWYAEKTFVINLLSPFFRNARKEITKSPVAYFSDLGLRNYALNIFGHVPENQIGFLFQNLIANIAREKLAGLSASLHFWRTKDRAEVDLIIEQGDKILPIEVKYKHTQGAHIEKSLINFISKYSVEEAWVVNLSFKGERIIGKSKVRFIPLYEFIGENFNPLY